MRRAVQWLLGQRLPTGMATWFHTRASWWKPLRSITVAFRCPIRLPWRRARSSRRLWTTGGNNSPRRGGPSTRTIGCLTIISAACRASKPRGDTMLSTPWAQRKNQYDFVIIGSGYGGAIAAARLAAANLNPKPSVCILQRGDRARPRSLRAVSLAGGDRVRRATALLPAGARGAGALGASARHATRQG